MYASWEAELQELDGRLVGEHRADRGLFDRLTDLQRQLGVLHGERPLCRFLRPYFLTQSRYRGIQRAAGHLYTAFSRLTRAALEEVAIAKELGATEKELRWARIDRGHDFFAVTSRLDTFLSQDGFAFLEYNGENPAGIGDQPALETLFSQVPLVREFLTRVEHFFPQPHLRLLDELRDVYRVSGGRTEKPSIAIVDWKGVDTAPEFEILAESFREAGHEVCVCDPNELEYRNRRLVAEGFEIDILYKRVIIHEFLERFDETHALYDALNDRAVCMINPFTAKLAHKKSSFALLSDPKYRSLFSAEEADTIDSHVPWTRKVRYGETTYRQVPIDLIEHVRSEREQLVLKPNDDYGGHGVKLGWAMTPEQWDDAIELALSSDYVVQERVKVEAIEMPAFADGEARMERLNADFDPFLFRGEVEGGMVRLAPGDIVNVTQGGGETALAIVKGI